ncbi:MAG: response regulator transcription factor [Cytophagales bacterium]|nr:response regulator transcription factor [Cytophagales bacterium]
MIKILIADDHTIVRVGLKQMIGEQFDMKVIGEAVDGMEAIEKVQSLAPNILILDILMPGLNGIEILKQLKKDFPKLYVIMFSIHGEDLFAVRSLKAGASAYLSKDMELDKIIETIRVVSTGRKYISNEIVEQLVYELNREHDKPPHELLSDREFEVLRLIGAGKTNSQIAEELFLSVKTISTFRARILEKMNLKNNSQLTHYVIQHSLLEEIP